MISITINGKALEVKAGQSLTKLLEEQGHKLDGTAIAINETIVPKQKWAETVVENDAHIDIFNVVAGG